VPLAPPRSLSPSKVTSFTNCPLAFRLSVIDRIPEPPSAAAVKGTLVHTALEGLIWGHDPGDRTRAAAATELELAWQELRDDLEFAALGLDDDAAREFRDDAETLIGNYFEIEDPDEVRAVGIEVAMEVDLGAMRLRGIIDRLDVTSDGDLVVIDYKTGRAPSARYEQARLTGVFIYALLCEKLLGRTPVEVRLLHLRDPTVITAAPTAQTVRAQERRTSALWQAIDRACAHGEFRPKPGPLCRFCNFQSLCPQFGGQPPAVPVEL
jgi:putative RecB family exonuclease